DWVNGGPDPWGDEDPPPLEAEAPTRRSEEDFFALTGAPVLDCLCRQSALDDALLFPWDCGVAEPDGGFPALFVLKGANGGPFWTTDWAVEAMITAGISGLTKVRWAPVVELS